jgi:hypothetical protein
MFLVQRTIDLGGHMQRLDESWPTSYIHIYFQRFFNFICKNSMLLYFIIAAS